MTQDVWVDVRNERYKTTERRGQGRKEPMKGYFGRGTYSAKVNGNKREELTIRYHP